MATTYCHWAAYFFGLMFAYSGLAKARGISRFRTVLAASGFVPPWAAAFLSRALPTAEVALAILLLAGPLRPEALIAAGGLVATFTVFVVWSIRSKQQGSCFCFGEHDEGRISGVTLGRNLLLLGLLAPAILLARHDPSPLSVIDQIITALQGTSALLVFLAGFQVASLWQESRRFA